MHPSEPTPDASFCTTLYRADPHPVRPVDLILVGCTNTPSSLPLCTRRNPALVLNAIHEAAGTRRSVAYASHFNPRLKSIGVHYVVDVTGEVWLGRHLDEPSAVNPVYDQRAIAITLVGHGNRYTRAQWSSLRGLVLWRSHHAGIALQTPLRTSDQSKPDGWDWRNGIAHHRVGLADQEHDQPGPALQQWLLHGLVPRPAQLTDY